MNEKITTTVEVFFDKTNEIVFAEVINTEKCFAWRLRIEADATDWNRSYFSVITIVSHNDRNIRYGYATAYWEGTLPVKEPFMITVGNIV